MSPNLCIWLIIIIMISPVFCEEVAYVYDEFGSHPLESGNITEYRGYDQITFTVASSNDGSATYKFQRTLDEIIIDINKKVDRFNQTVRDEGLRLVGNKSGPRRIDQICSIYDYMVADWIYVEDWKGSDQYQYANYTLKKGTESGSPGKGDCDDFSILLASLVESIGGAPRIVFAYGPNGGHAYTEVYLGKDSGPDGDVDRIIKWLRVNYGAKEIYTHNDLESKDVWLNLDWWKNSGGAKHPGGPLFYADYHIIIYPPEDQELKYPLTPLNEPPIANFSFGPAELHEKNDIIFNASQSRDVGDGGNIEKYHWSFGDGIVEEGEVVTHAYSQGGSFKVNLTVTDNEGATSSCTKTLEVNGLPYPVINFEPKEPTVRDPTIVNFDASHSLDRDGKIRKCLWEFGDGDSGEGFIKQHIYPKNKGNYTVNLTVFDDKGAKNTTSVKIKINEPPVAIIEIQPTYPQAEDEVKFDGSKSSDADGHIMTYEWILDEGVTRNETIVSHRYSEGGNFTVKLRVKDDNNATSECAIPIRVNKIPAAIFEYMPENPEAGKPITFNASKSMDEDGNIANYEWDFGDGYTPFVTINPLIKHPYLWSDNFTVKLTVTDNSGAKGSSSKVLMIKETTSHPPFTENQPQHEDKELSIPDKTSTMDGDSDRNAAKPYKTIDLIEEEIDNKIDIGNPLVRQEALQLAATYSGYLGIEHVCSIYDYMVANWSYVADPRGIDYFQYANETLLLGKRMGKAGAGDSDDFAILMASLIESIGGTARIVLAYEPNERGHFYTEVYLGKNSGPNSNIDRIIKWLKSKYNAEEIHTHFDANNGDIWLNLDWWEDSGGEKHPGGPFFPADIYMPVYAREDISKVPLNPPNEPPIASFTYDPIHPTLGMPVIFNASSSSDPDGKIVKWAWDFGDEEKMGEIVTHPYWQTGEHTVTLTVTDNQDCVTSSNSLVTVEESENLELGIIAPVNGESVPISVDVEGTFSGKLPEDSYLWLAVSCHETPGQWWIQGRDHIHPSEGKWSWKALIGKEIGKGGENDIGKKFDIAAILADTEANQQFLDYIETGNATDYWPGIQLPKNAIVMASVTVIREEPRGI